MPLNNDWLSAGGSATKFGHADWMALRRRGITSAQQLAQLHDNQQYLTGPKYEEITKEDGTKETVRTHRGNKQGVAYREGTGVENSGGLFNQIRLHAQSQAKPWSSVGGVRDWDYNIWGGKGFGAEDIKHAGNRGASPYQLKQLHERAGQLGIRRDNSDAEAVLADAPVSPWDFGAYGGWGFGERDVQAMDAEGWNLDRVKGAKQFAKEQGLNIGSEVDQWIVRKQGERDDDADDVDWQTNQLQPLKDEIASLTAQINEPVEKPGVGYSAPSVVGKSGTRGARLQTSRRGSRGGTSRWKRSSWSMPTVNTGSTSGKASNSSPVNV